MRWSESVYNYHNTSASPLSPPTHLFPSTVSHTHTRTHPSLPQHSASPTHPPITLAPSTTLTQPFCPPPPPLISVLQEKTAPRLRVMSCASCFSSFLQETDIMSFAFNIQIITQVHPVNCVLGQAVPFWQQLLSQTLTPCICMQPFPPLLPMLTCSS